MGNLSSMTLLDLGKLTKKEKEKRTKLTTSSNMAPTHAFQLGVLRLSISVRLAMSHQSQSPEANTWTKMERKDSKGGRKS